MPIAVSCPCGARFAAPETLAGKQVKCPQCTKPVRVNAKVAASGPARKESGVAALLDEVELSPSKTGRRCPECRNDLELDDLICVNCGYNTETGKKIRVKKVEQGKRYGNVVLHDDVAPKAKLPPEVESLVKLLNQAGILAVLMAAGVVAYLGYQRMQADPQLGSNAFVEALTGPGLYLVGGAVLLVVVPAAIAASLVQKGNPAGRILSLIVGFVALLGFPLVTLIGALIIKQALSHEIQRFCR